MKTDVDGLSEKMIHPRGSRKKRQRRKRTRSHLRRPPSALTGWIPQCRAFCLSTLWLSVHHRSLTDMTSPQDLSYNEPPRFPAFPHRLPGAHDDHHRPRDSRCGFPRLPSRVWQDGTLGNLACEHDMSPRSRAASSDLGRLRWTLASAPSLCRSASSLRGHSSPHPYLQTRH